MPKIMQNGVDYSKPTHVINRTINNYTNSRADILYTRTLTSEDDLNNITDSGIYGIPSGAYPINIPNIEYIYSNTNYTCSLTVQKVFPDSDTDKRVTQSLIVNCPENPIIFVRTYHANNNTWDYWRNDSNTIMTINNSEKSIVDIAKVLGQGTHNVRMRNASGSPYGDGTNDFIYTIYNTVYNSNIDNEDFNWCRIIAFDANSTKMYKKSILGGIDHGWKLITNENTIQLGEITDIDRIISEGTDFNNLLDAGQYIVSANTVATNCINIPTKVAGTLFVTDYTGTNTDFNNNYAYRVQTYITYDATCIYTRFISKDDSDNGAIVYDRWKSTIIGGSCVTITGSYLSLAEFVSNTNNENTNYNYNGCMFIVHDMGGWGPLGTPNKWYKGMVLYQNAFSSESEYSLGGSLFVQNIDEANNSHTVYFGAITGNRQGNYFPDGPSAIWNTLAFDSTVLDVTRAIEEVNTISVQNRDMLIEKAAVVLQGHKYSSLIDFVIATDTETETDNANGKFVIFTDISGWGPTGIPNTEYRGIVIYKNYYKEDINESIDGNLILYTGSIAYSGYITGNMNTELSVLWDNISTANHTHDIYANTNHTHSNYMTTNNAIGTGSFSLNRKNATEIGKNSFVCGENNTASKHASYAEGYGTTASGDCSHAEGDSTTASGPCSHAEGSSSKASGDCSHAEGNETIAYGNYSHAEGCCTIALHNQHAQGHYNDDSIATENSSSGTSDGTAFVIGNGMSFSKSNAFRVTGEGQAIGKSSFASTGADYAEYFEWGDGNPNNEDRVGYFVTFADGRYIEKASEGDYILGIISGLPCVVGNNDECWLKRFEMDEWGRYIYETTTHTNEETGEVYESKFYKLNPEYDSSKEYIHRQKRPEWSAVGMVGVLSVRDDGTCQVNGYCKCTNDGIATASERGVDTYRVIERVNDNIIKVALK